MKKKITFLAIIVIVITLLLRMTFVCNGEELENVVYKSDNLIVHQVQSGNDNLVILGSGYSLSINNYNKIVSHDPFMIFPENGFENETVMSVFYPFESEGLEEAGKELSTFINSISDEYSSITLIGHSKCGVCFANSVKWMDCSNLNVVTTATPFKGTPIVDETAMSKVFNWFDSLAYSFIFSNHVVDRDIIPGSDFINGADYSGLAHCTHINIVSKCPEKSYNPIDIFLMYLNEIANIQGDGIAPASSQRYVNYSNTIQEEIYATHATSFNISVEIAKSYLFTSNSGDS